MLYSIAAILVLILDQAVKYWTVRTIDPIAGETVNLIPGVIHMTNVQNQGAAFSILADQRWLLVAISLIFIIGIIVLISMDIIHTKFGRWTAVLVMAGALGNCIDRVLLGYVVDMFDFDLFNFAVFNVADIFITVCGILFCIHVIVYREPEAERNAVPRPARKKSRRAPEPEEDDSFDDDLEDEPATRRAAKAPRERGRKAEDPYARVPHRGQHRTLEEDLRLQDPDDPFSEWDDADFGGEPAPRPKAKPRPAAGADRPAARKPRSAQPAAQPAKRQPSAMVEDTWVDDFELDMPTARPSAAPAQPPKRPAQARPAAAARPAPKKPAQPAKRQAPAEYDEYSLEDILSEFRDL